MVHKHFTNPYIMHHSSPAEKSIYLIALNISFPQKELIFFIQYFLGRDSVKHDYFYKRYFFCSCLHTNPYHRIQEMSTALKNKGMK